MAPEPIRNPKRKAASTAPTAPLKQAELDFETPPKALDAGHTEPMLAPPTPAKRMGPVKTVTFRRGKMPLGAAYEGDLAVTGNVGKFSFEAKPLNEAYSEMLRTLCDDIRGALDITEACEVSAMLHRLYREYAETGIRLHTLAEHSVLTDGSRLTTGLTMAFTYTTTVLSLIRGCLGDGEGTEFTAIDVNLGGMESFACNDMDWPFTPTPRISRVARTDLSRDRRYHARMEDPMDPNSSRVAAFMELMSGDFCPGSVAAPSVIFHPLADAFRASPESMTSLLVETVAVLKEHVIAIRRSQPM